MKAQFHKHQKVWVEAVGAWASVEKIVPTWAKGFDEPVKITYDVGLGRDFSASELRAAEVEELKDHQLADEGHQVLDQQQHLRRPGDQA